MNQTKTFAKITIGAVAVLLVVAIVLATVIYTSSRADAQTPKVAEGLGIVNDVALVADIPAEKAELTYSDQAFAAMPKTVTLTQMATRSSGAGGVTVNATVQPDTAVNKNVVWQVSWENPNETFAVGKVASDYISVTPASAGSRTATITCLQPFGATIQVSVISEANPGVYAILTVDYEKRIEDITVITTNEDYYFDGTTLYLDDTSAWSNTDANYSDNWNLAYSYGVGSVDTTAVSNTAFYIKASNELVAAYSGAATDYVSIKDNRNDLLEKGLGVKLYRTMQDKTKEPFQEKQEDGSVILSYPTISVFNAVQWNSIVAAFDGLSEHAFDMKVVVTTQSGNVKEIVVPIYIDTDSIGAQVSNITVDQSNIIM